MKISYRNTKNADIFSSLLTTKHAEIKILPPLYWIPSTALMLSPTVLMLSPTVLMLSPNVLNTLHSTEAIPVLMLSPTVLKNLQSTEGKPPHVLLLSPIVLKVWRYPSTVLMLSPTASTVLKPAPHSTEAISPLYWATSTVLKLSSHSTEAILPQYWCYPPDVLNNLQCTEQPPKYWTDVIWGDQKNVFKATFTRDRICSDPFGIGSTMVRIHSVYIGPVRNWNCTAQYWITQVESLGFR